MNEGEGTTLGDSSTNALNGTLFGPGWVVARQAPVVGPVTLWRTSSQILKASDLMMLTNSIDPEGTVLILAGVSPTSTNNGTVSLSGRWIIYTPPGGNDDVDYFDFMVENEFGVGATGTASVVVITPVTEGQSMNIAGLEMSSSNTLVRFVGIPGRQYTVESTSDLESPVWENIGSVTIGSMGYAIFVDARDPEVRFYRTVRPE